ncbi:hypothetical protein WG66_009279 [Moniliophthora roreri]|nr:hypothetical protein WG66_009279 [Moniliophthora roreri]
MKGLEDESLPVFPAVNVRLFKCKPKFTHASLLNALASPTHSESISTYKSRVNWYLYCAFRQNIF